MQVGNDRPTNRVMVLSYKVIIILSKIHFECYIVSGIVKADNDSHWPKMFATQGTKQEDG